MPMIKSIIAMPMQKIMLLTKLIACFKYRDGGMSEAEPGLECDAILIGEIRIEP